MYNCIGANKKRRSNEIDLTGVLLDVNPKLVSKLSKQSISFNELFLILLIWL